jgi:hypothetical protein
LEKHRCVVEGLEGRFHLSITWANAGKTDGFDRYFKSNAAVARTIVMAALADWNKALPKVNLRLQILAGDLNAHEAEPNTLGLSIGAVIRLDNDGGSRGWYFDQDLADNSDFVVKPQGNPFTGGSPVRQDDFRPDFYTTVAHEICHSLGFSDATGGHRRVVQGRVVASDSHHSNNEDDLM